MDFEQWFAVFTLLVPLVAQLGVTLMLRRDLTVVLHKVDSHETRLDNHDLTFAHAGIKLVGKQA
jgi:hypothetical protein